MLLKGASLLLLSICCDFVLSHTLLSLPNKSSQLDTSPCWKFGLFSRAVVVLQAVLQTEAVSENFMSGCNHTNLSMMTAYHRQLNLGHVGNAARTGGGLDSQVAIEQHRTPPAHNPTATATALTLTAEAFSRRVRIGATVGGN